MLVSRDKTDWEARNDDGAYRSPRISRSYSMKPVFITLLSVATVLDPLWAQGIRNDVPPEPHVYAARVFLEQTLIAREASAIFENRELNARPHGAVHSAFK